MAATGWFFDEGSLGRNLGAMRKRLLAALTELGHTMAAQIRSAAQQNAPWTDRTSQARQRLMARAFMEGTRLVIILFHQVHYGIWLEVRWAGRWGVIMKTINQFFPQVMRLASRLVMGT